MTINKMLTTKLSYPNKNKPKYIVIHETDNWNKGAGARNHARAHNNGNMKGSAHYYVDDENIYQTLEHKHGAWAVGDGKGKYGITNLNSISIEICVNPDSDYEKARLNAVELTKHLMKETGIGADKVIRHYDASRKKCPRRMMDNPKLWEDFKARIGGKPTSTQNKSKDSPKTWRNYINGDLVRDLQRELNHQFNKGLKVDGWFGDDTINALVNVRRGAKGNLTRIIQLRLESKGYKMRHGADGRFGYETEKMVRKFQKDNGLTADGIVGKETWKALFKK